MTVFLVGAECPMRCVFCDLWRHTLEQRTPEGAILAQVEFALARLADQGWPLAETRVKLYNASNFFEPRSVPDADAMAVADLLRSARRVVVESHPKLLGQRCQSFVERLGVGGAKLEVAMGLETAHPAALRRMRKGADLDDFAASALWLRERGIALRIFLLIGVPFIGREEQIPWLQRSVETACRLGAERIALIPTRSTVPAMERLRLEGEFAPPTLTLVEQALEAARALTDADPRKVLVSVDSWDLEALAANEPDAEHRIARLQRIEASDP
ncbi:MAG TPA: hypothetical protein VLA37_04455 [Sphingomonadaceae bacterium]|nr:hypothetical protein [Sphingomonadaceae bacterium]